MAAAVTVVEEGGGVAVRWRWGWGGGGSGNRRRRRQPAHAIATVSDARAEMRKKLDRKSGGRGPRRSKPTAATASARRPGCACARGSQAG